MGKSPGKKKRHEPWYLTYLLLIPLFLIAVVPEGFFTWQVMVIFAVLMCVPFVAAWLYNRSEPDGPSTFEMYSETLKRNNELKEQEKNKNKSEGGSL